MRSVFQPFPVVCALVFGAAAASAQFDTGSLVGTVHDSSGAVVPGATVTVTNTETGAVTTRTSSNAGEWEAPSLRTGVYRVTVTHAGFADATAQNLTLSVGGRQRVDLTLQVGAANEVVEVSGVQLQLETDSSERGQVVTHEETVALPLVSRNYSQLVLLTSGTRQSGIGTGSASLTREGSFNVEGQRSTFNNYLLDGLDNNQYGTSNQGFSNQIIQPTPDSITQFQVVTNNESAEYGRSTGATVNVAFASGTNKFHFLAYDFLRNTSLNAIGFFNLKSTATGQVAKPVLHRNQFGGNFSGPILHDRLFFFLDYEGFRQTRNLLQTLTVPTLAMDQGYFPVAIKDPYLGTVTPACTQTAAPFTGCTSIFASPNASSVAKIVAGQLATLAAPNLPGISNNYQVLEPFSDKSDKYDLRLDYTINQRSSMFVRASQQKENAFDYPVLPLPLDGGTNGKQRIMNQQIALGYTRQIGSNQLLEVRLGASYTKGGKFTFSLNTPGAGTLYGLPGLPDSNPRVAGGLPTLAFTGESSLGRQATNPQWQYPFLLDPKINYSWVKGRHSLKFGYEYERIHIIDQDVNPIYGRFTFQGNFTGGGNPYGYFADFLYGAESKYELTNFFIAHMRQVMHFGYVQDDWRATDKLTLNMGLRYEYGSPYWDKDANLTNWDPQASGTTGVLLQATKGDIYQRSLVKPDKNDFAPRFGFAYAPDNKTALRGGFGISFIHFNRAGSGNELAINAPQVLFVVVPQAGGTNGPSPTQTGFRRLDLGFQQGLTAPSAFNPLTDNITYIPKNYRDSYVESYFLSVQRQLAKNSILDLAYVGNHGLKLLEFANYNQKNPSLAFARPYPVWGDITAALNSAYANYNSLQVRYEQRNFHGLTMLNSFTWGRTFDNAAGSLEDTNGYYPSPQDINNIRGDYGPSNYDQPLTNITSLVYELPVGHGRRFASSAPRFVDQVIGGYELALINTATSGQPLTVQYSPAAANQVSGITADFRGANNYRPNRVGGANVKNTNSALSTANYVQYLSAAAFTTAGLTGAGASPFGNARPGLAYSPAYYDLDATLSKSFALTERARLQFRAEGFNVLNKTNLAPPSINFSSSAFGRITSNQPARVFQFALKLSY